jgi:hypothetical protein
MVVEVITSLWGGGGDHLYAGCGRESYKLVHSVPYLRSMILYISDDTLFILDITYIFINLITDQ